MTKVQKLEKEINELNQSELEKFRNWFRNYDSNAWDRQIESDLKDDKLKKLAEEALEEYNTGDSKEL